MSTFALHGSAHAGDDTAHHWVRKTIKHVACGTQADDISQLDIELVAALHRRTYFRIHVQTTKFSIVCTCREHLKLRPLTRAPLPGAACSAQ